MIRTATESDICDMIVLQQLIEEQECLYGFYVDSEEDWRARDLTWTLVYHDEDRLIAFIHCLPMISQGAVYPAEAQILNVAELLVAPSHQSRGIGHQLVESIKSRAREEAFTHMQVYSAAKRFDDILRFYRDCGFSPWQVVLTQPLDGPGQGDS